MIDGAGCVYSTVGEQYGERQVVYTQMEGWVQKQEVKDNKVDDNKAKNQIENSELQGCHYLTVQCLMTPGANGVEDKPW